MKSLRIIAFVSIVGGILIHLAVLTVIRIQPPLQRAPEERQPAVEYVGNLSGPVPPSIMEQAALMDSAPLFMPTRWNLVSQMGDVASLREATEIFEPFAAQLRLPVAEPGFPGSSLASAATTEPELPEGPAFTLSRFGRTRTAPPSVRAPGPSVRVDPIYGSSSARRPAAALPAAVSSRAPPALWTPVRFYLQLSEGIPVGIPLLSQSSGFADWDEVLQNFLGSLDFYRNLDDGYYSLSVFP